MISSEGRSVGRAPVFFAGGYISFTALAVLWMLGGIARGMGRGGLRKSSLTWWFFAYSAVKIALVSQLCYLLLELVIEDAETLKKRVLTLIPILATGATRSRLSRLDDGSTGHRARNVQQSFIRGGLMTHAPEDTIGESFFRVGFVYLLLLLAAFVLTVAGSRESNRESDEPDLFGHLFRAERGAAPRGR